MKFRLVAVLTLVLPAMAMAGLITKAPTIKGKTSFAVIVDAATYEAVGDAVDAYRTSIEQDGLPSYLVVDDWKSPEGIRTVIAQLRKGAMPLEGFVLVGDIPIPMIRDAQHMTTAFKLDQEVAWHKSSVPSDRFYDDLDLKFTFLKQDSVRKLMFYYSLAPDSPQRIDRDLYSGRIKAPVEGKEKFALLRSYLLRVAKEKKERNVVDRALMYTGYGYHSEAMASWEGNSMAMREIVPSLYLPGGRIENMNFAMDHEMKAILLQKVQAQDLDIALFHAHGAADAQLIVGEPVPFMMDDNVQAIKRFIRSKLRSAKRKKQSTEEILQHFEEDYGIPRSWSADAFTDSTTAIDSVADSKQDIESSDVEKISPQARFVMFDECFNGSFHQAEYIAGKYVFGTGKTVAAVGNSVNILQDVWANEHLGLIPLGVRIGQWHQFRNSLETHIVGDPTFRFTPPSPVDVQSLLSTKRTDRATWRKLLKNDNIALRALAVTMMIEIEGKACENDLSQIFRTDPSFNVRLAALKGLAMFRSPLFEQALVQAADDPYEFIRRMALIWMGETQLVNYAEAIARSSMSDPSERVQYAARNGMDKLGFDVIAEPLAKVAATVPPSERRDIFVRNFQRSREYYHTRLDSDLVVHSLNDTLAVKSRVQAIRTFRLYNYQDAIPLLIRLATETKQPDKVRITALEAMGWYSFSHQRGKFIDVCNTVLSDASAKPDVKGEALKTKNRLLTGSNDPVTP